MDKQASRIKEGLEYPFSEIPTAGEVCRVAAGIYWLRMPLPFRLDHINLWLLEDGEGWTIVDSGINRPETEERWERIFATALAGKPVKRVIVTHWHPDHVGMAAWLQDRWQVPVSMTQGEWLMAQTVWHRQGERSDNDRIDFCRRNGLGEEGINALIGNPGGYRRGVRDLPGTFYRLRAGDRITIDRSEWRIIIGTGHAPEHACLYCPEKNLLISGDQVLPRISTNVSVWSIEPEGNPLGDFLGSIPQFRTLPEDVLVLPSHNTPFYGLHRRLDQLDAHHLERLELVRSHCATPHSAADLIPVLFRRELDVHQLSFAMGEAVAHLHYLEARSLLLRHTGEDRIHRFAVTESDANLEPL